MAEYIFEDMTAEQAFGVGPGDLITVRNGSAMRTTVIFTENALYQVTIEGKTLLFPSAFREIADGSFDGVEFPDGSRLHVGDSTANSFRLTPNPNAPVSGAAYGGGGDDSFTSGGGDWLIQGNQGNDFIQLGFGRHTVYGGQDNDHIRFENYADNLRNQFVQGNKGDDTIGGAGTSDTLLGGQGNDLIDGAFGVDYMNGNLGDDRITGTGTLLGEGGNDTLAGGFSAPTLFDGGAGNDHITVAMPSLSLPCTVIGGVGDDTLVGYNGAYSSLYGGAGNDVLSARGTKQYGQYMEGGDGDDVMSGGDGVDTLVGGSGNDSLAGSLSGSADRLFGGEGADLFRLSAFASEIESRHVPMIMDWSMEDRIELMGPVTLGYAELVAPDSAQALTLIQPLADGMRGDLSTSDRGVIVVELTTGLVVYSVRGGLVEGMAGFIPGRTLVDISLDNFI